MNKLIAYLTSPFGLKAQEVPLPTPPTPGVEKAISGFTGPCVPKLDVAEGKCAVVKTRYYPYRHAQNPLPGHSFIWHDQDGNAEPVTAMSSTGGVILHEKSA
jgi:hypothetical protein